MNAIAALNVVTSLGFLVAMGAALALPTGAGRHIERNAKLILALAMAVYVLVGISNVLEYLEITTAVDIVEDYVEVAFFPLLAYVAYSVDATDRISTLARIQDELRHERDLTMSVVNASPAAIVMVDHGGTVRFTSEHVRTLFGLAPGGQLLTRDLWLRPYGRAAGEGPRQSIADIAAQAPFRDALFVIDRGDSEHIVSASAETSRASGDAETVVAFVDVTERLVADEELAAYRRDLEGQVEQRTFELMRANEKLEAADRGKRNFLAKLSHELRTPLNSIVGFTGVLLRGMAGTISGEQRTQLEMIQNASKRLLSLVNDILDVSRIETGQAAVAMRPVNLHPMLACVIGEQRLLAEERRITLEFVNDSTRPEVRTDVDKVEQIVNNLVSNAVRFTPEGGTVTITLSDVPDAVAISVSDTGPGLSPKEKDHVFEPFYDGAGPVADHRQGMGLGWSIARELAVLIGADISVSSAVGKGSRFTVKIPVA